MPRNDPATGDLVQPFALGKDGPTVLLIHGFTGTPFEMRFLGERLASRGFRAVGVMLPGHGLDPYELERARASDWVNEARAVLLALAPREKAFIVGLSMGSLIGAILAADHPERVAGLVLCAPPVRLSPRRAAMVALSSLGVIPKRFRFFEKRPSDLSDAEMAARMPALRQVPALAAARFDQIRAMGRVALPKVTAPAMIVYSMRDRTVPPSAAEACARLIGSRPVRMLRLERSAHVLTLDAERERVADAIEEFFRSLR